MKEEGPLSGDKIHAGRPRQSLSITSSKKMGGSGMWMLGIGREGNPVLSLGNWDGD